jgi:hypothetical protein
MADGGGAPASPHIPVKSHEFRQLIVVSTLTFLVHFIP